MKKIFNICLTFLAFAGLTSCLEEDPSFDPKKVENVIEFYATSDVQTSAATAVHPLFEDAFDIAEEVDFPIVINYAGAGVAPEDITVTLELDPGAIERFNEDQGEHFVLLPAARYSIPSMTVTIPKGERRANFMVKLRTNRFTFDEDYALAFRIANASSGIVSGNFSTAVFSVKAKNAYDGVYTNTYTSTLGNGTNSPTLTTTGQYSVTMNLIGVYSNQVVLTVDPATNRVTVSMTTLLPIATDPSSRWDPATKTFHLKWTSNGGARTFNQTMVKK